jgi:Icc-related predicted phosphoesterase
MKIACISDTHGILPDPQLFHDADLVLHAGDVGSGLSASWYARVLPAWADAVLVPIVCTWGNHDRTWMVNELAVPSNLHILVNEAISIDGLTVWASPYSLPFGSWSWMATERELAAMYEAIPTRTDIVVTHGPAYGLGDLCADGHQAGSQALLDALEIRPFTSHVVSGHIHEARGVYRAGWRSPSTPERTHVNASCLDLAYTPHELPITWIRV